MSAGVTDIIVEPPAPAAAAATAATAPTIRIDPARLKRLQNHAAERVANHATLSRSAQADIPAEEAPIGVHIEIPERARALRGDIEGVGGRLR